MHSTTQLWNNRLAESLGTPHPCPASESPGIGTTEEGEEEAITSPLGQESCFVIHGDDERQWLDMDVDGPQDLRGCEFIYGIPISLIALLRTATRAVEMSSQLRLGKLPSSISSEWEQRLFDIEAEILEWPMEQALSQSLSILRGSESSDASIGMIENTTKAFYNAIIIYFSQHVRLMHHRHLRPYVSNILDHLDAIEGIKDSGYGFTGPIYWPFFIAASEAFDESLQRRFRIWFDRVKSYGFQAALTGNEIAQEVWDQEIMLNGRTTSRWRTVMQKRQAHLILT